MITVDQAYSIVESSIQTLAPVYLPLDEALHHVLARDIVAGESIPAFDNSAMDGYALRSEDEGPRKVVSRLRAGQTPDVEVKPGEAVRIMTGAPLPPGANAVLKFEDSTETPSGVIANCALAVGENVRKTGDDIQAGAKVLSTGLFLRPAHLGVMASLGIPVCPVYPAPRVAILATGDELVDIDSPLRPGQVRNSSSVILAALVRECGAIPVVLGVAPDDPEVLKAKLLEGLEYDALITAGGVSMGDYDYVGELAAELGQVLFTEVAQQPGKPFTYGVINEKPFFGLPGNPVSSMVTFEIYVRPALLKMMGRPSARTHEQVVLQEPVRRKPRRQFLRAIVEDGAARLTGSQSSGVLNSMALANALLVIPEGTGSCAPGSRVEAIVL